MSRFRIAPVAPDGWKFIIGFGFLAFLFLALGLWFAKAVGVILAVLAVFSVAFFRDPDRDVPPGDGILSPADGTVMEVATVEGEGYGTGRVIRIFLSVFDNHIQRAPAAGTVKNVEYMPGLFLDARDPRAPFANESNMIEIVSPQGRIAVKQIAGLIARRIVCWIREDDEIEKGERIGLIRFGSQVDLYLPSEAEILAKEGDKVVGGVTVLAQWSAVGAVPPSEIQGQAAGETAVTL